MTACGLGAKDDDANEAQTSYKAKAVKKETNATPVNKF